MYEIKFKKIWVGFAFLPFIAMAQPSLPVDGESEIDTMLHEQQQLVRDLIQTEKQRLSEPLEVRRVSSTVPAITPPYAGADLILKAMYGVDNRILAEISFRGKSYLYLRGQTWPLGDRKGQSQLRLLSMSSRCIHVAHKEEQFDACVLPEGGQP